MVIAERMMDIEDDVIQAWEKKVVPEYDVFYFPTLEEVKKYMPEHTLVIPREEFSKHNSYQTIDMINSYEMWQISKEANYVCVVPEDLFQMIDRRKQQAILNTQQAFGRGLIFDWELIEPLFQSQSYMMQKEIEGIIEPYILQNQRRYLAFQRQMWTRLPGSFKRELLIKLAELYTTNSTPMNMEVQKVVNQFQHIIPYFNRFSKENGSNCFAAVLAAATENRQKCQWLINQWIHPETFQLGLEWRGYKEVTTSMNHLNPKDILIWQDENGQMIHTTFYLGRDYFFNKALF